MLIKKIKQLREMQRRGARIPQMDVETAERHKCLNCNTDFRGDYCPCCGQNANVGRLKLKNTLMNFIGLFTKMNRGVVHTIVDLLYRPGFMMRDYIEGHRAEYASPLLLIFVMIALDLILPFSASISTVYPEQWAEMFKDYPVSYWLTRAWVWIWEEDRRICIFAGILLTPSVWLTAKIIRAGFKPNFAEAFHISLYFFSVMLFLGVFINQLNWIPEIGGRLYTIADQVLTFVLLPILMVFSMRDCLRLNWIKMLAFVVVSPIVLWVSFVLLFLVLNLVLQIDLPKDIYKKIDLLFMI